MHHRGARTIVPSFRRWRVARPQISPPHSPHLQVRKIVYSFRLETELNALASTRMFIERVRLAPLCFSAQYIAEMWSVDKILKVRASRDPSPRHLTPQSSRPSPPPPFLHRCSS